MKPKQGSHSQSGAAITTLFITAAKHRTCIRNFRFTNVALYFVLKYTKEPQTNKVLSVCLLTPTSFLMKRRRFKGDERGKKSTHVHPNSHCKAQGWLQTPKYSNTLYDSEGRLTTTTNIQTTFQKQSPFSWSCDLLKVWPGCKHTSLHEVTEVIGRLEFFWKCLCVFYVCYFRKTKSTFRSSGPNIAECEDFYFKTYTDRKLHAAHLFHFWIVKAFLSHMFVPFHAETQRSGVCFESLFVVVLTSFISRHSFVIVHICFSFAVFQTHISVSVLFIFAMFHASGLLFCKCHQDVNILYDQS